MRGLVVEDVVVGHDVSGLAAGLVVSGLRRRDRSGRSGNQEDIFISLAIRFDTGSCPVRYWG